MTIVVAVGGGWQQGWWFPTSRWGQRAKTCGRPTADRSSMGNGRGESEELSYVLV